MSVGEIIVNRKLTNRILGEICDDSFTAFTRTRILILLQKGLDIYLVITHGLAPSSTPTRPARFDIECVIRPNVLALHPYWCARDAYSSGIQLNARMKILSVTRSPDSRTTVVLRRCSSTATPWLRQSSLISSVLISIATRIHPIRK